MELTTFFLYRGLVHHHHRILNKREGWKVGRGEDKGGKGKEKGWRREGRGRLQEGGEGGREKRGEVSGCS